MIRLNSSAIEAADYDYGTARLFLTFTGGDTYTYYRVPESIFIGLVNSTLPGTFYHRHIAGRYRP